MLIEINILSFQQLFTKNPKNLFPFGLQTRSNLEGWTSTIQTVTILHLSPGSVYISWVRIFHNLPKAFFLRPSYPRVIRIHGIFRKIAFVEYLFELLRDRVKCREFDKPQLTFSHLCRMRYILQPWLLTRLLICPAETFLWKMYRKEVYKDAAQSDQMC